ncbi:MAG: transcription antitermination protein NusB [Alphaproteobacteria bacterium]|nr:transcription antitermination protein NusB [Alphaproteobacteria bacterium]
MNPEPLISESSSNARNSAARLAAVQALYQIKGNDEPVALVIEEYRQHRLGKPLDGVELVRPDSLLFERILKGVAEHAATVQEMLASALNKDGQQKTVPTEPLLNAILSCGALELMTHQDVDAPIIIADYLNITHAFYDQGEYKLVNAVLDRIKGMTRS